ncbi:hypothetical protein C8R44DRAFT_658197 [Mycena epipterygia]|nr:hypothetical protein C8R44DRAFT_658197 [Mycena epipterygia]
MDTKAPVQFQTLPFKNLSLPVSNPETARLQRCQSKKKRRGRFLKAFGLSALIFWLVAGYFRPSTPAIFAVDAPWPIPSDVSVDHCAEWSNNGETDALEDFPYSADASFELPLSADTLFLISRSLRHRRGGVFSTGLVDYVQSEDVSDSVKVDITAYFWHDEYLDASKACLIKRAEDQTGVGIFTNWQGEDHRGSHHKLRFQVTVTFPQTSDGAPLSIKNFSTDLELFSQTFADMSNVDFKSLAVRGSIGGIYAESLSTGNASIRTSLGAIKLQSLVAESANVATSMGPIEGTFNSSNTLILRTSNGAINVDVNLSNNAEKPAKLQMRTSNGAINSTINLESESDTSAFDLTARTSHGPVKLDVVAAPVDSTVNLRATTSIGALAVKLPPTYEGSFTATTSLASLSVNFDETLEDPTGAGRKRKVDYNQKRGSRASGSVGWSEEGKTRGEVNVRTSLAPIVLEF